MLEFRWRLFWQQLSIVVNYLVFGGIWATILIYASATNLWEGLFWFNIIVLLLNLLLTVCNFLSLDDRFQ